MRDDSRLPLLEVTLLESLGFCKSLVFRQLIGELALARKFRRRGLLDAGLSEQKREESRADLRGLKPLLHQTIGELGLVGVLARCKKSLNLAEHLLGTLSFHLGRGWDIRPADTGVGELLQILDLVDIASGHERGGHPLLAGTTRASDAVNVVLRIMREIIVDDHLKGIHIDTTRSHIGSHEELELRVLELVHDSSALGLGDTTMEPVCRESLCQQCVGEFVNHALGIAENDSQTEPVEIDEANQGLSLASWRDLVEKLLDIGRGHILPLDRDSLRIARVAVDELFDRTGQRGGEEDRLTLVGRRIQDLLDIVAEAHVEHAIRLIQNRHLELVKFESPALQMVDDTTGGSDDDLDTFLELEKLTIIGGATIDGN